jgi:hypothetical protein
MSPGGGRTWSFEALWLFEWEGAQHSHSQREQQAGSQRRASPAQITDPALVNARGMAASGTSPFRVSDNTTGISTLYRVDPVTNVTTKQALTMSIPGARNVTGQVFASVACLYAANFRAGTIDVVKGSGSAPNLAGAFTDPNLPAGYSPFNVQNIGGKLYVTYALQDSTRTDDVAGAGHGFVDVFDLQGVFLACVASQGTLDSPWDLALAPSSFGQLSDGDGNPLTLDGPWVLAATQSLTRRFARLAAGDGGESRPAASLD